MQIQPLNNTCFKSRNQTIRFADDIARRVNQCYPRVSSTKVECCNNISKFPCLENNLMEKVSNCVRKLKSDLFDEDYSFCENIKAFITPVKKYKIGNCGESAQLSAIVAKVNGIKDCHLVTLVKNDEEFDHAILLVNDKKPYIIDAWLGFADYVPNTIQRYKNEYYKIFNFEPNDKITIATDLDNAYGDFFKDNFTRKQINKIKRIYPEQFIQRGYV